MLELPRVDRSDRGKTAVPATVRTRKGWVWRPSLKTRRIWVTRVSRIPAEPPLGAAASYLRIAARYEAMAAAAEREGNAVRAANQRKAAATYRTLATRASPWS